MAEGINNLQDLNPISFFQSKYFVSRCLEHESNF